MISKSWQRWNFLQQGKGAGKSFEMVSSFRVNRRIIKCLNVNPFVPDGSELRGDECFGQFRSADKEDVELILTVPDEFRKCQVGFVIKNNK